VLTTKVDRGLVKKGAKCLHLCEKVSGREAVASCSHPRRVDACPKVHANTTGKTGTISLKHFFTIVYRQCRGKLLWNLPLHEYTKRLARPIQARVWASAPINIPSCHLPAGVAQMVGVGAAKGPSAVVALACRRDGVLDDRSSALS
jgi:hypothetical protein